MPLLPCRAPPCRPAAPAATAASSPRRRRRQRLRLSRQPMTPATEAAPEPATSAKTRSCRPRPSAAAAVGASQSVTAAPPVTAIFFSLPLAKNPIHWPSGEKNGLRRRRSRPAAWPATGRAAGRRAAAHRRPVSARRRRTRAVGREKSRAGEHPCRGDHQRGVRAQVGTQTQRRGRRHRPPRRPQQEHQLHSGSSVATAHGNARRHRQGSDQRRSRRSVG